MFTKEQLLGFIRHALTLAGGALVTNGLFTESELLEAVGAASTLIGFVWSWMTKRDTSEKTDK
jgi:amino acid permease